MAQQTAVEFLYNNLKSHFEYDGDLLEVVQISFEQAKKIEKCEIIASYMRGNADVNMLISLKTVTLAENYYNEIYNK